MTLFSALRLILTMHCDHSSHLLSDALDRPLNRVERTAVALHLMICRNCRRFRDRLRFLTVVANRLMRGQMPSPASGALSPEARRRIEDAIRQG